MPAPIANQLAATAAQKASSTVGTKVLASLAAGTAAFMTAGSYKAYSGVWDNQVDVANRNAMMDYQLYTQKVAHTGNGYVPGILHWINHPGLFNIPRRMAIYTSGLFNDVIAPNAIPLALGTLAVFWGFNLKAAQVLKPIAKAVSIVAKTIGTGLKALWKAFCATPINVSPSKILKFFMPKSPQGVLATGAALALGGLLLPYELFKNASADDTSRVPTF